VLSKIKNDIKQQNIAPLYLLYGTESFLINETRQFIISHAISPDEVEFNISQYDLEETPIELAIEDAETLPFLGEKKIVVLKNPVFLTAEKTKEKIEHHVKALERYIESPSPFTVLIFIANYEKLDDRKKITKLLKKHAVVLEAKKFNDEEIKSWLKGLVKSYQLKISEEAAELLIGLIGPNLTMLANELEKISLFVDDEEINEEVIYKVVSKSLEQNIFSLVDYVIKKDVKKAIELYQDLLKVNEDPIKILAILANQFRMIYQTKAYIEKGYSPQQIASYLKVHPYRIKIASQQAKLFKEQELLRVINELADADYDMKTGRGNKERILELILLKL